MKLPLQIEFNRPAKYTVLEELGSGACGRTVKIHDEDMNCDFVAKKYSPFFLECDGPNLYRELLDRFRDEARILFKLNHQNVVRVFNYYDYSDLRTAYIIMEYISGVDIVDYLSNNPANADKIFEGVIDGFSHLEKALILHRDIRPQNILVNDDGTPKIIDFGFGKQAKFDISDHDKSISLNWWCETPPEFEQGIYDFQTEIYFVGKLFQKIIEDCNLSEFKYVSVVRRMSNSDRNQRSVKFEDIQKEIVEGKFTDLHFLDDEIWAYRNFADSLMQIISSIQNNPVFERDTGKLIIRLETLYRKTMLEEYMPLPNELVKVFLSSSFRYWTKSKIQVSVVSEFIKLLKGLSEEKRSIIVENLAARLSTVEKSEPEPQLEDEIPF